MNKIKTFKNKLILTLNDVILVYLKKFNNNKVTFTLLKIFFRNLTNQYRL